MLFRIEVGHDCLGAEVNPPELFCPSRLCWELRDRPLQFIRDQSAPGNRLVDMAVVLKKYAHHKCKCEVPEVGGVLSSTASATAWKAVFHGIQTMSLVIPPAPVDAFAASRTGHMVACSLFARK